MTWWGPRAVAGFAAAAGFERSELEIAVAVALAGSGGHDTAENATQTPPQRRQRGLWLIPLGVWLDDPAGDLWRPDVNARAARALWVADGGGWAWSSVWRAGTWRDHLAAAADAAAHPENGQEPPVSLVPLVGNDGGRSIRRMFEQFTGKVR